MSKKTFHKEVKVHFVIPSSCESENGASDCMKMAFQEVMEADLKPQWVTAEHCARISTTKNTVFIMQDFDGDLFEKLRSSKSVVCGPMCIRSCIADGLPIPDNKGPVFSTAMRDVIVTASQVSPQVKGNIKEKVGFMGGVYMSNLVESVTHLVTNAVRSAKYEVASERGIPAMTVSWVETSWELSKIKNMRATDPSFMVQHKCPIFLNMFITCSNLAKREKEQIKELVTKNGGTFTAQLRQKETTLLVIGAARGEKYVHARSWDLPCVMPSYITESVQRGYAVPSKGHLIEPSVSCSTPTKDDETPNFTYNSETSVSMINLDSSKSHIEESQMTNISIASAVSQKRQPHRTSGSQHAAIVKSLSVSDAKKAGPFTDGCKIFLSGFSPVEEEKLRRIVSLGGATVFSELTDSVSHVLVGDFVVQDVKALSALAQKPHVVTIEWLATSIKQKCPVAEETFYCLETRRGIPEPPSPLSQKGMQLLQPPSDDSETKKMPPPAEFPVNRKLFSDFLKENAKSPAKQLTVRPAENQSLNSTEPSLDSTMPEIFNGHKFVIAGFSELVTADIETAILSAGGSIVAANFTGVADYAVVPVIQITVLNITAMEVVTNLWLEDCLDNKEVVPLQYYHQPLSVAADKKPLSGCCLSLSNYCGKEKAFLTELTTFLGATYQDVFARVAKEDKGVLPSTHLVCPKPDGQKFKAAVRWGLPTISKDWLLASARLGTRVDEGQYLVNNLTDSSSISEVTTNPVTPSVATPSAATPAVATPSVATPPVATPSAAKPISKNCIGNRGVVSCVTPQGPASTPPVPTVPLQHPSVSSLKRKSSAMTSEELSPFHVSTPDTPYGQVFETPTAETKKRWKKYIDDFPYKNKSPQPPPVVPRRDSTPLSELKRKIWQAALEESGSNVQPNYSIEEMDEDQDNADENLDERIRSGGGDTPKSTPMRGLRFSQSASKDIENTQPRRISAGRSTPTVSDFNSSNTTPLNQPKGMKTGRENKDGLNNGSSSKQSIGTPQRAKKSPANEMVCAMLDQLHQRLSTPGSIAEEPQPLPQRELISPSEIPASSQKPVASTVLPESQPNLIGWEDPVESAERAKYEHQATCSPRTSSYPSKVAIQRKFVLSNVKERDKYEDLLSSLGETVITESMYDNTTTHLIVDEPLRSEKLLCCLAAGKWVLHTSYIDHMVSLNKYLPEEEKYEWGNPLSSCRLPPLSQSSMEHQLAQAAERWRKRLQGSGSGAFSGMRAVLITSASKFSSYKRLIMAGNGEILNTSSILEATHCFVDTNKIPTMPVPLAQLVAHKVPCLPPVFLGDMLIKFPAPKVEDGLIPEYRRLAALQADNC